MTATHSDEKSVGVRIAVLGVLLALIFTLSSFYQDKKYDGISAELGVATFSNSFISFLVVPFILYLIVVGINWSHSLQRLRKLEAWLYDFSLALLVSIAFWVFQVICLLKYALLLDNLDIFKTQVPYIMICSQIVIGAILIWLLKDYLVHLFPVKLKFGIVIENNLDEEALMSKIRFYHLRVVLTTALAVILVIGMMIFMVISHPASIGFMKIMYGVLGSIILVIGIPKSPDAIRWMGAGYLGYGPQIIKAHLENIFFTAVGLTLVLCSLIF